MSWCPTIKVGVMKETPHLQLIKIHPSKGHTMLLWALLLLNHVWLNDTLLPVVMNWIKLTRKSMTWRG